MTVRGAVVAGEVAVGRGREAVGEDDRVGRAVGIGVAVDEGRVMVAERGEVGGAVGAGFSPSPLQAARKRMAKSRIAASGRFIRPPS